MGTDMDIGMGTIAATDMVIVMVIAMDMQQEEELVMLRGIAPETGILHRAIFIEIEGMASKIPAPGLQPVQQIQAQDHRQHQVIHLLETDLPPSQEPGKTMFTLIKVVIYINGITVVIGKIGAMDNGTAPGRDQIKEVQVI